MNREEIKLKFDAIQFNSQYIRVTENHPLELYLGKNDRGYLTLRYNGNFVPSKIAGSELLEVKQVKTSKYFSILFSYNSRENVSLFINFCEDIINQTSNYFGEYGYKEIVNRYIQWKKMFSTGNKILSENEVLGLIGELLFLKDIISMGKEVGVALSGWSGPEPTHKDFSYENNWFEIKSINSFKNSVFISSIEQLDSDIEGDLVIYSFEKMSQSFDGISLNALVLNISNMLKYELEKDVFFDKLKKTGYFYNEVYDNYVYNLVNINKYRVANEFPRIKASNLPRGVGNVKYELLLSFIEKFKEE